MIKAHEQAPRMVITIDSADDEADFDEGPAECNAAPPFKGADSKASRGEGTEGGASGKRLRVSDGASADRSSDTEEVAHAKGKAPSYHPL